MVGYPSHISLYAHLFFIEVRGSSVARDWTAGSFCRDDIHCESESSRGNSVCVFPEGTTTLGDQVGLFHASIFQPVVNVGAKVTPVSIRYLDKNRVQTGCPAYVGDMTLLCSLDQVVIESALIVEVSFLSTIDVKDLSRESISDLSRAMILTDLFK
jgi:1-acyl-sn-glycerol-3-phosphate acyltransferase